MQTIEELEMKAWLNRAFYANQKAKALEKLAEQCKERAQGLTVNWEQNDKGKSDGAVNGTENALLRLTELNEKAHTLRVERKRGFSATALAMEMRWRWPPENSCG